MVEKGLQKGNRGKSHRVCRKNEREESLGRVWCSGTSDVAFLSLDRRTGAEEVRITISYSVMLA